MTPSAASRCPAWCVADHIVEDEPGDIRHRSEVAVVAAILKAGGTLSPEELLIELSRSEPDIATWVYLGDGWSGFSLSLESARRLHTALATELASAGPEPAPGTLGTEGL